MTKKDIGKVYTFKLKFTDETVTYTGYLLGFNKNWIHLKYCSDYFVDGYILLNSPYIVEYKRGEKEKFTQKILDLKGHKPALKESIPIHDTKTILEYLTKKFRIFTFYMRSNKACWLGKVNKIVGSDLKIDFLTPRAKWSKTMPPYKLGNIRKIEYDNDYINSLMLLVKNF